MGPLGISLMLVSLGAQAFGAAKSAQENNRLYNKLLEKSSSLDDVFKKEYNMDYMETPSVKNTLASYGTQLKEVQKNAEGRAEMSGASPESVIAEKQAMNENYGDFIRKVASGQDAYKADKERTYQQRRDALDNQIFALDKEKAGRWGNLSAGAAQLGAAGLYADSMGSEDGKPGAEWWKKFLPKLGGIKGGVDTVNPANSIYTNPVT